MGTKIIPQPQPSVDSLDIQLMLPKSSRGESEDQTYVRLSFFERLQNIDNPDDLVKPTITQIFPLDDFISFALYHDIESKNAQALFKGAQYSVMVREGLLQRLWNWVRGFHLTESIIAENLKIPIAELHAPNVQGTETFYTVRKDQEEKTSLSVSVGGFGAGQSISLKVTLEAKYPVSPGDCVRLICDGKANISKLENKSNGKIIYLTDAIEVSRIASPVSLQKWILSEEDHICTNINSFNLIQNKIKELGLILGDDYDTASPEKPSEIYIEIEKNKIYNIKWSILEYLGGENLGLEVKSNFNESVLGSFKLQPGYNYIAAYTDVNLMPLIWVARKFS